MKTREAALKELRKVFAVTAEEYRDKGLNLPSEQLT
jgi:predicted RNase H-like HicB family nuclease